MFEYSGRRPPSKLKSKWSKEIHFFYNQAFPLTQCLAVVDIFLYDTWARTAVRPWVGVRSRMDKVLPPWEVYVSIRIPYHTSCALWTMQYAHAVLCVQYGLQILHVAL